MIKLTTIGSSVGIVLPKEALILLNVAKGDRLFLTELPDGSYRLTPCDPRFSQKPEVVEQIMRKDKEILRALTK